MSLTSDLLVIPEKERERERKNSLDREIGDRSQNAKYFFKERVFRGTKDTFLQPNPLREV